MLCRATRPVGHHPRVLHRWVSVVDWLPRYRRRDLSGDLVGGLTGAAVMIPQSMAYAQIGGVPPVVGLYASIVPAIAYAALGRSRQLSIGPLTTVTIIGALAVGRLAPAGSDRFIGLTATLALMVGAISVLLALARLGFLMRFVSEPVVTGFLAGAAIVIIANQLGALFGYHVPTESRAYATIVDWADRLDETNLTAVAIGAAGILFLLATRRVGRLPSALIYVAAATLAVGLFDLDAPVLGAIPSGLAGVAVPPLEWDVLRALVPAAVVIVFVGFVEALGVERELADKHHYEIDPDQELLALGTANSAAGLFQGMVVTGVPSRTAVVDAAGGRTQAAGIVGVVAVLPVVFFLTGLLHDLPDSALAAVVIVSIVGFIRLAEMRRVWRIRRSDGAIALLAFAGVVVLGIELGVIVAAVASIVMVVYRATTPRILELGRRGSSDYFVDLRRHPDARTYPGVVILRPDAPLNFASVDAFDRRLRQLTDKPDPPRVVLLDASGIDHLDTTADHHLRKLVTRSRERGIRLVVVNVDDDVTEVMHRSGLARQLGPDAFFATDADAITHLEGLDREK